MVRKRSASQRRELALLLPTALSTVKSRNLSTKVLLTKKYERIDLFLYCFITVVGFFFFFFSFLSSVSSEYRNLQSRMNRVEDDHDSSWTRTTLTKGSRIIQEGRLHQIFPFDSFDSNNKSIHVSFSSSSSKYIYIFHVQKLATQLEIRFSMFIRSESLRDSNTRSYRVQVTITHSCSTRISRIEAAKYITKGENIWRRPHLRQPETTLGVP